MSGKKHGRGAEEAREAWEALVTFASVGVRRFDITVTDLDGGKRSFRPAQELEALRRDLPELMASGIRWQHNLIVRPRSTAAELVQLDDLGGEAVEHWKSHAFLSLTTSPGNHQAWIALPERRPDLARCLRRLAGADPCASGATRLPGSINYKRQYAPDFPMVRILQASPRHWLSWSELESMGLLTSGEIRAPAAVLPIGRRPKIWPSYQRCMQGAPMAHGADRPDISRADFTFCLLAIDWGWSIEETSQRLLQLSHKARARGEAYARQTAERAQAAVARRR